MLKEDRHHEFKSKLNDDFEKEVVAFVNSSEGGHIYIGIDDNGTVLGIEQLDKIQLQITNRLRDAICPSIMGLYDVIVEEMDGKQIIHLTFSSGLEKPYYIRKKGLSTKGVFMRVGSSSQPMPQYLIDKLFATRVRVSLFHIPAPKQNLTFQELKIYYISNGYTINDLFLKNLDFYMEDGRYNYIAYLFADKNDV